MSTVTSPAGSAAVLVCHPANTHLALFPSNRRIDYPNDEPPLSFHWTQNKSPINNRNKRSANDDDNDDNIDNDNEETDSLLIEMLVIWLHSQEIIIYSPNSNDFTNKISSDSKFSALEVIYTDRNLDHDIITFNSTSSTIDLYSSISPSVIRSIPFKEDSSISNIIYNDEDQSILLISEKNSKLYLLNMDYKLLKTIDLSNIKFNSDSIFKFSNGYIYISYQNSIYSFNLYKDLDSNSNKIITYNSLSNINDYNILQNYKIISASLIDGSIDLFNFGNNKPFAKLQINGGSEIGKLISFQNSPILNNEDTSIIDNVFKLIWYDNFNIKITDLEFNNIKNLENLVKINVTDNDHEEIKVQEEGEIEEDNEEAGADKDISQNMEDEESQEPFESVHDLKSQIENYINDDNKLESMESDNFIRILSNNVTFIQSLITLLEIEQTTNLFIKACQIVINYHRQSNNLHSNMLLIDNIKQWLKFILILRGSILLTNKSIIPYLKSLQNILNSETKHLVNMVKLSGKLTLLNDQLTIRREMMSNNNNNNSNNSELNGNITENDTEFNNTTLEGASVVLDGEGGFDYSDEEEEDADADADAELEQEDDE